MLTFKAVSTEFIWDHTLVIPIATLLFPQNLQNRLYIHDEQGRSMQVVFTENYKSDHMLSSVAATVLLISTNWYCVWGNH